MKPIIKALLEEMIFYRKTRQPKQYFATAHQEMGMEAIYSTFSRLIGWWDRGRLNDPEMDDPDKSSITTLNNVFADKIKLFLKHCPEMKHLIKADLGFIYFADGISEAEKKEIRDYVHTHADIKLTLKPRIPPRSAGN